MDGDSREEPVGCSGEGANMPVEFIHPIISVTFVAMWAMIGQMALRR